MDNCYIVGTGAIGSLLYCRFAENNLAVNVIGRRKRKSVLHLVSLSGQSAEYKLNTVVVPETRIDILLLPVKAYQVLPAIKQLRPYLHPKTLIVLMHNGLGTIEPVSQLLPQNTLLFATTTHGAYKPDAHTVHHTGLGASVIGGVSPETDQAELNTLLSALNQLLPPFSFEANILPSLWRKLAINAVINPLTAINGVKNGALADTQYKPVIECICEEVSLVANANQIDFKREQILGWVYQVIEQTAENYSSMNRDVAKQQPTEIDYINGYIVECARRAGISVPENERLWQQVLALQ
jgi:2-dehydropantoate 2-reductase